MTTEDATSFFDVGGPLDKAFPGYEYREGQLLMSQEVIRAYRESGIAVLEAGTGIGKSFAYLLPALIHAEEDKNDRTVIATATINLQDQLMKKDIPSLFSVLGREVKVACVLGRSNYLCKRKACERAVQPTLDTDSDELLRQWVHSTKTGLKSESPVDRQSGIWEEIASEKETCLGQQCPFFNECFYMRSRQEAEKASLIVTNHHVLFSDSSIRHSAGETYEESALLPSFSRLIIDEAHNIEDTATEFFTGTYSRRALQRSLRFLVNAKYFNHKGLVESLADDMKNPENADSMLDLLEDISKVADEFEARLNLFRISLHRETFLLTDEHRESFRSDGLADNALQLYSIAQNVTKLAAIISSDPALDESDPRLPLLAQNTQALFSVVTAARGFVASTPDVNSIYWFESYTTRHNEIENNLHITPMEVAEILDTSLWQMLKTVVCTSATLQLNDEFRFWSSRTGLDREENRLIRKAFSSPFNYKEHLLLLTPQDAPVFDKDNQQPYVDYVVRSVKDAVLSSGGGALVLFTSYAMLNYVADNVEGVFTSNGIRLLRQGKRDRFALLKDFKEDKDSVLFANSSFWEGIDAPGDTLRLLIITKLPFLVPDTPVNKARETRCEEKGESGFWTLALPMATMKLKQGFGRLIRTADDSGIVLILDGRITKKGYGSMMSNSLPECARPEILSASVSSRIESFLY